MQRLKISTIKHTEERVTLTKFKEKLGYISHQEQSCHQATERVPRAYPGSRIQMCTFMMGLSPAGPEGTLPIPSPLSAGPGPALSLHHTGQKCPAHTPGLAGGQSDCAFQWQLRHGLKELTSPLDSPAPISFSAFANSTSTGASTRNKPGKGHKPLKNLQSKAVPTPHPEGQQGR